MWGSYRCLTSFFPIVHTCLSCEDTARQSCSYGRGRLVFFLEVALSVFGLCRSENHFELIPTTTMETRHPVEGYFGSEFPAIWTILGLWRPEVARVGKMSTFGVFWKNYPLREKFQNSVSKGFTASPIHVLCANFVKLGWRDIGKLVRSLNDKKNNFTRYFRSRYCVNRTQSLSRPAPDNVLRALQISSKSVHFRRSYSRTREHHRNAPYSKLFPIFHWSPASSRIIS